MKVIIHNQKEIMKITPNKTIVKLDEKAIYCYFYNNKTKEANCYYLNYDKLFNEIDFSLYKIIDFAVNDINICILIVDNKNRLSLIFFQYITKNIDEEFKIIHKLFNEKFESSFIDSISLVEMLSNNKIIIMSNEFKYITAHLN